MTQHAGSISKLDLSSCPRITDAGIAQLGAPDSPSLENLTHLYLTGCPQLTNISLDHLKRCKNLVHLDVRNIPQITVVGLSKFLTQIAEADSSGARSKKLTVKHSYPASQLDKPNLHQNYYQSEMISSTNSLTTPGPHPGVASLKQNSHSISTSSPFSSNKHGNSGGSSIINAMP